VRIAAGGTFQADVGAGEIRVASLAVEAGGRVDVGAGRLTIAGGVASIQSITALVMSGHDGGTWAGTGVTSSLAAATPGRGLGWRPNDDTSLTVAFAAPGDTNLDGLVDQLDLAEVMASALLDTGVAAGWWQGDFTYDGVVDILDISELMVTGLYDQPSYLPVVTNAFDVAFAALAFAAEKPADRQKQGPVFA